MEYLAFLIVVGFIVFVLFSKNFSKQRTEQQQEKEPPEKTKSEEEGRKKQEESTTKFKSEEEERREQEQQEKLGNQSVKKYIIAFVSHEECEYIHLIDKDLIKEIIKANCYIKKDKLSWGGPFQFSPDNEGSFSRDSLNTAICIVKEEAEAYDFRKNLNCEDLYSAGEVVLCWGFSDNIKNLLLKEYGNDKLVSKGRIKIPITDNWIIKSIIQMGNLSESNMLKGFAFLPPWNNPSLKASGYFRLRQLLKDGKIQRLRELINKRETINIDLKLLITNIITTCKQAEYEKVKEKLEEVKCDNLDSLLENILEIYEQEFGSLMEYIYRYAVENKITTLNIEQLFNMIKDYKKEIEINNFEKKIFKDEVTFSLEEERKSEKLQLEEVKRFLSEKMKLSSSDNYVYIINFVKKYKYGYDGNGLNNLRELLYKKGYIFTNEELSQLSEEEKQKQNYLDFKEEILHCQPQSIGDYIKAFIDIYEGRTSEYIDFFERLLQEGKISLEGEDLYRMIDEAKKDLELKMFEKDLAGEVTYSIEDIDLMSGYEFESFLKKLFEKMGYKVEHTKFTGDQGGDLVISKLGGKTVVQAKRCEVKVSNDAVQEVVASINYYKCNKGMVVTNSEFTTSAIELAKSNNITLIDGNKLKNLIRKYF